MPGVGSSAVQTLATLSGLLYVLVVTAAGIRLLLLARSTGGRPEALIGTGSVLIAGIGFPASVASGFGGLAGAVNLPLWVTSEAITQAGIALFYLFTQQVFRPEARWARGLCLGAALYMPLGLAGAGWSLAHAAPGDGSIAVTSRWLLACFVAYGGCFVWSAGESLREHRRALRRVALGLADPAVANRFLLWSVYALCAAGSLASNAVGVILGCNLSTSPVVLVPTGVLCLVASVAVYLAFVPPAWYLARIRGGAPS
jgi:hypothetical protein